MRRPRQVHLVGHTTHARARTIQLPAWSRPIIAAALDLHLAQGVRQIDAPLTFAPRPLRGVNAAELEQRRRLSASASVSGSLQKRLDRKVGLVGPAPTPTGIVRWRIGVVLTRHGEHAAMTMAGKRDVDWAYNFARQRQEHEHTPYRRGGYIAA